MNYKIQFNYCGKWEDDHDSEGNEVLLDLHAAHAYCEDRETADMKWRYIDPRKLQMRQDLLDGKRFFTPAARNGSREWWVTVDKCGEVTTHNFGTGRFWEDQGDDCVLNFDEMVDRLWESRFSFLREMQVQDLEI